MKTENKIITTETGRKINLADYHKAIRERVDETNGRYLNIGKPQAGHTCHHIVPYASCRNVWENTNDNDEYEYYLELACNRENIIELPYKLHKILHKVTFKRLKRLYFKDKEGRKYIPKRNMNAYLIGMLNGFCSLYRRNHNHYPNFHLYLKEYALLTVELLDDNKQIKELGDDLADMTHAFSICEQVRYMVDKMRRVYL